MTLSVTCPRCDAVINADDADEVVARVHTHARVDHKLTHALSGEHILARLRVNGPEEP